MQADASFIYQPDLDSDYPYTSWSLIVSYQPVRGTDNQVDDLRIDGIDGATAWCGKWGASIVLDAEYRREVLAWLQRELDRSRGNDYGLWHEIGAHCLKDWQDQLSYAE